MKPIEKIEILVSNLIYYPELYEKNKQYVIPEAFGNYCEVLKYISEWNSIMEVKLNNILNPQQIFHLAEVHSKNFLSNSDIKSYLKEITKYYMIGRLIENYDDIDTMQSRRLYEFMQKLDRIWIEKQNPLEKFNELRAKVKELWRLWVDSWLATDKYTQGLIPWKVYTIWAFSNIGKSKLAYFLAQYQLKAKRKVMFISLEVDTGMLMANLICSAERKKFWDVISGKVDYTPSLYENCAIYDDLYQLEEIISAVELEKPDVCIIDFVQNIRCKGNSEYEKMTNVAQELQSLVIRTNCTLINLSQVNNDSRFNGWDKITLKWSGALFASSDIIFILNRENDKLYLTIAKNKYWQANIKYDVIVDFETGNFRLSEINTNWF